MNTDIEVSQEVKEAMTKAKIGLMAKPDTTFFTTVLFNLEFKWTWDVPTACTNGKWIAFNPDFFMEQTPDQRIGLLLHEVFHVVWMHMLRLGERDLTKWNIATDFVINLLIIDRGFKLPKGGLLDEQYRGMSADEVYNLLPVIPPEEVEIHFTDASGDASGDSDEESGTSAGDLNGTAPAASDSATDMEAHIQDLLIQAHIQSQAAGDKPGSIPGEIAIYINRLLKPKLPTAQLLRRFLYDTNKDDYTWTRPNRRYMPKYYLPSLHTDSLGHIAVFIDASGSVTDAEFLRFVSEVGGIMKTMRPKKISLITFDTAIREVQEITSMQDLAKASFIGRGGTEIRPVLKWCEANRPKVALVFTDGHFYFRDMDPKPKTPIIWLIDNNPSFKAPVGKVVHYEST